MMVPMMMWCSLPPPFILDSNEVFRDVSEKSFLQKVESILDYITLSGLTLDTLVDAVCWGDDECVRSQKVRLHRSTFTNSTLLPGTLKRLRSPQAVVLLVPGKVLQKKDRELCN